MQRKTEIFLQKSCPRCSSPEIKAWDQLSDDEKFLVEKLPLSSEFSAAERKKHRFCTRCFFEEIQPDSERA